MPTIKEDARESSVTKIASHPSPYLDLALENKIDEYVTSIIAVKTCRLESYESQAKFNSWTGLTYEQQQKEFADDLNSALALQELLNQHSIDTEWAGESVNGQVVSDFAFCNGCSIRNYHPKIKVRFRDCETRKVIKKRLGL